MSRFKPCCHGKPAQAQLGMDTASCSLLRASIRAGAAASAGGCGCGHFGRHLAALPLPALSQEDVGGGGGGLGGGAGQGVASLARRHLSAVRQLGRLGSRLAARAGGTRAAILQVGRWRMGWEVSKESRQHRALDGRRQHALHVWEGTHGYGCGTEGQARGAGTMGRVGAGKNRRAASAGTCWVGSWQRVGAAGRPSLGLPIWPGSLQHRQSTRAGGCKTAQQGAASQREGQDEGRAGAHSQAIYVPRHRH